MTRSKAERKFPARSTMLASAAKAEAKKEADKLEAEIRKLKADVATFEAKTIKATAAEKTARDELEEAQRKLKTANPEVAAFKALFDDMQRVAARLKDMVENVRQSDGETADKLAAALKAFGSKL